MESVCLQCGRPRFDPWVGKFPGEGNGKPLQYSCLENPMDEGAWCPWGRKELDTTEWLHFHFLSFINRLLVTINIQLKTSRGVLFLPPSDAYVRSFLYLFYTLIKLYHTKALSEQALSLAPDWIPLLWRPRIPVSFRGSATTFQLSVVMEVWGQGASIVRFWWECFPYLAHGHLLTISSHHFPLACVHNEGKIIFLSSFSL